MIEGVEILSQTNVYETALSIWPFFLFFGGGIVAGLIFSAIEWADCGFSSDVLIIFFYLTVIGFLLGIIGVALSGKPTDTVDYIEYKVTVSDNVNFTEFNNKYEILDQEGRIYTIREWEE